MKILLDIFRLLFRVIWIAVFLTLQQASAFPSASLLFEGNQPNEEVAGFFLKKFKKSKSIDINLTKNDQVLTEIFNSRFISRRQEIRKNLMGKAKLAIFKSDHNQKKEAEDLITEMEKIISENRTLGIPGIKGDVLFYAKGFVRNDENALQQFILLQEQLDKSDDISDLTNLIRAQRLAKILKRTRTETFVTLHLSSSEEKNKDCTKELEGVGLKSTDFNGAVPGQRLNYSIHCRNGQNGSRELMAFATQKKLEFELTPYQSLVFSNFPIAPSTFAKMEKKGIIGLLHLYKINFETDEYTAELFSPQMLETAKFKSINGSNEISPKKKGIQLETGGMAQLVWAYSVFNPKGSAPLPIAPGVWGGGGIYIQSELLGADFSFIQSKTYVSSRTKKSAQLNSIFTPRLSLHAHVLERNWGEGKVSGFVSMNAGYLFLFSEKFGRVPLAGPNSVRLGFAAGPHVVISSKLSATLDGGMDISPLRPASTLFQTRLKLGMNF